MTVSNYITLNKCPQCPTYSNASELCPRCGSQMETIVCKKVGDPVPQMEADCTCPKPLKYNGCKICIRCGLPLPRRAGNNKRRISGREKCRSKIMTIKEEYQDCPYCPNQGWYAEADFVGYDLQGYEMWEQIQVQCEFCWTNPLSKFNNQVSTDSEE